MRRRKRLNMLLATVLIQYLCSLSLVSEAMLLLTTNCLALTPGCSCSWRSGKYVADCSSLNLDQVPKNDYSEYLMSKAAANNERDIQQLNLSGNNISELSKAEFALKKFGNLQKLNLNSNRLASIHPEAFHKLTGLIDLDLSENALTKLNEPSLLLDVQIVSDEPPEVAAGTTNSEVAHHKPTSSSSSFLQSLSQLRVLNLNSNQLNRLDKFAFSTVAQLRQLYLSRNQISSIDKLAFDGLDVLNILHLDGNKLSCLDGRILSQLPRLNAIQLAKNPWQCDCHLRELVRSLGVVAVAIGALVEARQPKQQQLLEEQKQAVGGVAHDPRSAAGNGRRIQLVDEPACQHHNGTRRDQVSSMISQEEGRRLWKNMKLGQFACPPRLSEPLMRPVVGQWHPAWELDASPLDLRQIFSQKNMNMNDSEPSHATPARSLIRLEETHSREGELVELTCAQELHDELELSEQTIEWWRIMPAPGPNHERPAPELLWRYSPQSANSEQVDSIQLVAVEQSLKGDKVAVIDYVTRANSSAASANLNKSHAAGYHQQLELVRVTHLLEMPVDAANQTGGSAKPTYYYYLCRIANQIYTLDLLYPVGPRSVNTVAQLESQRRESWSKAASSNFRLRDLTPPARTMGQLLSRIQLAKYQPTNSTKHLFVPIILPHQLTEALVTQLAGAEGTSNNAITSRLPLKTPASSASSSREPQQRSTVVSHRQTTNATPPDDYQMSHLKIGSVDEAADRLIGVAAIGLIHRYTSNRADLAMPSPPLLIQPEASQAVQLEAASKTKLSNATKHGWHLQPATTSAGFHSYSTILGLRKSNHWPILTALVGGIALLLTLWLSILLALRLKRPVSRQAEDLKRHKAFEKPSCGITMKQVDTSPGKLADNGEAIEEVSPCASLDYLSIRESKKDVDDADLKESLTSHFNSNTGAAQTTLHHPLPPALFMLSSKSSDSDTQSCSCHHHQRPQPIISDAYWSQAGCQTLDASETYQRQRISNNLCRPVKMLRFGPGYNGSLGRVAPTGKEPNDNLESLEIGCILNHQQPPTKEASYNTSSNSTSGCYDPFPTPNSHSSSHCDSSCGRQAPSGQVHHSRCCKQPGEVYSQGPNANLVYLDEALSLLQYTVNEEGSPMPPSGKQ